MEVTFSSFLPCFHSTGITWHPEEQQTDKKRDDSLLPAFRSGFPPLYKITPTAHSLESFMQKVTLICLLQIITKQQEPHPLLQPVFTLCLGVGSSHFLKKHCTVRAMSISRKRHFKIKYLDAQRFMGCENKVF